MTSPWNIENKYTTFDVISWYIEKQCRTLDVTLIYAANAKSGKIQMAFLKAMVRRPWGSRN
jgi:hypothetical protein